MISVMAWDLVMLLDEMTGIPIIASAPSLVWFCVEYGLPLSYGKRKRDVTPWRRFFLPYGKKESCLDTAPDAPAVERIIDPRGNVLLSSDEMGRIDALSS